MKATKVKEQNCKLTWAEYLDGFEERWGKKPPYWMIVLREQEAHPRIRQFTEAELIEIHSR